MKGLRSHKKVDCGDNTTLYMLYVPTKQISEMIQRRNNFCDKCKSGLKLLKLSWNKVFKDKR